MQAEGMNRMKRQATHWKKIYANNVSNKESQNKELSKLNSKKKKKKLKNGKRHEQIVHRRRYTDSK